MKIVCDSCGAKYSIADEKVAGKIFKIRCKKCSSVLEVRGDQAAAHPFDEASSVHDRGGEATWYIVVDGEQKGPLPPIELSQLFAKGSVGLDSYVWKEGFDDWKVAGDAPELTQVFGGVAAQAKRASAGTDDTSSFGTGGDLFGDGSGREPTSEIDTSSNMFAGFDESPTPTGSQGSPLAAASQDSGGMSFGGGAIGTSAPQRMTGQRNENSVLFSLTNLQQLASRGGSPAASSPVASQATGSSSAQVAQRAVGEGSGLIDIRALAKSTTPGTRTAPSHAVDDLLSIGTGGGASVLGAPLLGPTPLDTSDSNRWLWIGGAAVAVIAIVGAGIGVGMALGGSEDDALEITAAVEPPANRAVPGPNDMAAAAQPAPDAPDKALAAVVEPVEAATLEEEAPGEQAEEAAAAAAPEREAEEAESRKRSSTSPPRRQRTSRNTADAAPEPEREPKKRNGNNLDALMDEVVGGSSPSKPKDTSTTSSGSSDSSLPDAPQRDDVKTALQGVSGAVQACRQGAGGTATVDVTFSGKTGRASGAKVTSGPFQGTPVAACIESAVKRARVPRFKQSSFKVTFPYRL
ncbi:MAG: GYF domain-containing protein [Polyangiales bacterium]